jgi:hypothetical protein
METTAPVAELEVVEFDDVEFIETSADLLAMSYYKNIQ